MRDWYTSRDLLDVTGQHVIDEAPTAEHNATTVLHQRPGERGSLYAAPVTLPLDVPASKNREDACPGRNRIGLAG